MAHERSGRTGKRRFPSLLFRISSGLCVGVAVLLGATSRRFMWNLLTDPEDLVSYAIDSNSLVADDSVLPELEKLALPGLPNLGRVTETLYRGAAPSDEGLRQLRTIGVRVIVDFRPNGQKDRKDDESGKARDLGLRYISIPWSVDAPPTSEQVTKFLSLVRSGEKVFAHCTAGEDKTGLMVAVYRMTDQGWSPGQALAEMESYGFQHDFRHFWFYDIYDYIEHFPQFVKT